MLIWTIDKFINPEHAAVVYKNYYFMGGLGRTTLSIIGAVELVVLIGFLLGFQKKWTYGTILIFHAISTLSSYKQYFSPYDGPSILFFAAWPMLAACFALYILRDLDTRCVIGKQ